MTTLPTTTGQSTTGQYLSGYQPTPGALNGLIAPLQQLDRRLQQTIEVTQVLCGTSFQQYLLGSIVPAPAPAEVISAHSALGQLKTNFGLSNFEVSVVVMAIAPELDRRYERLYAKLQSTDQSTEQSTGNRKPTLSLALSVLCNTEAEQQTQRERLRAGSPLKRLLQPLNEQNITRQHSPKDRHPKDRHQDTLEEQTLQLKTAVSRYLLNQRSLEPLKQLATYCHLSWPQHQPVPVNDRSSKHRQPAQPLTDRIKTTHEAFSNSPVLSALISRIQQQEAPLPLSLQLYGQCRQKQQAAAHIAMATQAPLLRVNLTQLIHQENLNSEQSILAVEQVILQSQLWGAVLYLEDTNELPIPMPTFIHPGLIEKLSVQLAHYSGITIFAGNSPCMPTANGGKGILPIPLADARAQQQQTQKQQTQKQQTQKQPSTLTATQLALNEIEKFRLMLMQSSVEFG